MNRENKKTIQGLSLRKIGSDKIVINHPLGPLKVYHTGNVSVVIKDYCKKYL